MVPDGCRRSNKLLVGTAVSRWWWPISACRAVLRQNLAGICHRSSCQIPQCFVLSRLWLHASHQYAEFTLRVPMVVYWFLPGCAALPVYTVTKYSWRRRNSYILSHLMNENVRHLDAIIDCCSWCRKRHFLNANGSVLAGWFKTAGIEFSGEQTCRRCGHPLKGVRSWLSVRRHRPYRHRHDGVTTSCHRSASAR